ncbi:MAG: hypothetical protein WC629_00245 [Candidatus Paceibacterota bacterium]|jgi:hypothetical protein
MKIIYRIFVPLLFFFVLSVGTAYAWCNGGQKIGGNWCQYYNCGNVYDRWGNKGADWPSCSGYGGCNPGSASGHYWSGNYLVWTCTTWFMGVSVGQPAQCSYYVEPPAPTPVNGACGSINGSNQSWPSSGTWCSAGYGPYWTQYGDVSNNNVWGWTCNGYDGGGNAGCYFTQQCPSGTYLKNGVCSTNGSCGDATNNPPTASAPTTNLCSAGTATPNPVTNNVSSYNWKCTGTGNGVSPNCSVPHNTCSGANKTNYPTCDTCTFGNKLCSNGSCIANGGTCPTCSMSGLTSSISPAFVAKPSDTCTISWNASGTGSSCSTDISCTLDGGSTNLGQSGSKSGLPVGTHTVSCKDASGTTKTSSVKCMVAPGFGEF